MRISSSNSVVWIESSLYSFITCSSKKVSKTILYAVSKCVLSWERILVVLIFIKKITQFKKALQISMERMLNIRIYIGNIILKCSQNCTKMWHRNCNYDCLWEKSGCGHNQTWSYHLIVITAALIRRQKLIVVDSCSKHKYIPV